MENNKKAFSKKRLKIGSYGIALVLAAIAVVVLLNVVVSKLPASYTHFNMDTVDFFELGNETAKVLDGVKEDVNVYYVVTKGAEDPMVEEMLLRYKSESSKIKVKTVDPAVYPYFMDKYSEEELDDDGCLVFETSKRSKVITFDEIYYRDMSNVSDQEKLWAYLYGMDVGTNYFLGELAFTTAIDYVTRDKISTVYFLTGHGETELDSYFTDLIDDENILTGTLELEKTQTIPDDCTAIISVTPTSDYTDKVTDIIISYLKEGGSFILITDSRTFNSEIRPGISKVAHYAGLKAVDGTIYDRQGTGVEGDLIPKFVESPTRITSYVENPNTNTSFFYAHAIEEIDGGSDAIITSLLKTSGDGEIRVTDGKGSYTLLEGYEGKTLSPAVQSDRAVKDGKYGDNSCFVWFANSKLTDTAYTSSSNNDEFFMASIAYICKNTVSLSILGKTSEIEPLTVPQTHADIWMLVFTVVLPVAILGAGFVVWFRRRKL
ncbi:MAG: Gldg family protein [Clostridia bacterium]|nr:Gldg family protein [Clostridia bacterium]